MNTCIKCQFVGVPDLFNTTGVCKKCYNKRIREWNKSESHQKWRKKYNKEYRKKNIEKILKAGKEWRATHKKEILLYTEKYNRENWEKLKRNGRQIYKKKQAEKRFFQQLALIKGAKNELDK